MPQVTFSSSMNYTAPGGAQVNQPFVAVGSYLASSLGQIDVPSGALSGATFAIPFGSIANPVAFVVQNSCGTAINVRMQGNPTGIPVQNGGFLAQGNPSTPTNSSLSALTVVLTANQVGTAQVSYIIFGD